MIYQLLAGGLNPVDYVLIAALVVITVAIIALVVWQKVKGKSGCGYDCGSCQSCPSAKNGGCGSCTSCQEKQERTVDEKEAD